ncbi:hypothetical protein SUGI_1202500 [Cryptomeria japonica]|uniref:uncharacterized protein LOC131062438 isoform X1 n=1 Tax=Cryptomeria japonica TaxID=3369 RepID=UPI0024147EB9|nr:uncharacterized protein LOC131062438 isoform X1 [Cryptomeria japonica]GLJ56008.1 hypothetical protein SUGI_1202500 [Cryptomeria japonica]
MDGWTIPEGCRWVDDSRRLRMDESLQGRLKVVGRAGVGIDNVDLHAATEYGCLVVNAPTANTVAATEHGIALLVAMARNVPQASASMKEGDSKELWLHMGTFWDAGPAVKVAYKRNDTWNPFSMVLKMGIGEWGSPSAPALAHSLSNYATQ